MDTESVFDKASAKLNGIVFTGGLSKRMGFPKALLLYNNTLLYKHTASLLLPFVENIYFSHKKESCTLPEDENMIIYDVYPDAGPMGGILTALEHFLSPVLTLPCDTPRIDHEILTTLVQSRDIKNICTVFYDPFQKRYEPLIGIWEISAINILKEAIDQNQLSLQKILESNHVNKIPVPDLSKFKNFNTPEDWDSVYG